MSEVQSVLLIILGIGFALLLIIGIAMAFVLLRIITNIRHVTQRLDETSESMSEMVSYLGKKMAPTALSAMGAFLLRNMKSKIKKDK